MPRFRQAFSGPPNGPFTLNRDSPQAAALRAWFPAYPLTGNAWREYLSGIGAAFVGATARSVDSAMGHGINVSSGSLIADRATAPAWNVLYPTVAAWIRPTAVNSLRLILSRDYGVGARILQFRIDATKLGTIVWNSSNSLQSCTSTTALSANQLYHVAFTWDGVTIRQYINGVQDATTAALAGPMKTAALRLGLGRYGGEPGFDFQGQVFDVRMYDRPLSPAEVWQLWAPQTRWDLYRSARRLWIAPASAAVVHDLSGAFAGTAAYTGTLSVLRALAGLVESASAVAASLNADLTLAGNVAGESALDALLNMGWGLAGSVDSDSAVSGTAVADRRLAGSFAGASALAGALTRLIPLAGESAATSTLTGSLYIAGTLLLAGTITSSSALAGLLRRDIPVAGAVDVAATLSSSLTLLRSLAGSIEGESDAQAQAQLVRGLIGAIEAHTEAAGSLIANLSLGGNVAGQSTVVGRLSALLVLAGEIAADSDVQAALRVFRQLLLSGQIGAQATLGALLILLPRLVYPLTVDLDASANTVELDPSANTVEV